MNEEKAAFDRVSTISFCFERFLQKSAHSEVVFEEKLMVEVRKAFDQGEIKGRRSIEETLQNETLRLKQSYDLVESQLKEAIKAKRQNCSWKRTFSLQEREIQIEELKKRLTSEANSNSELKTALQYGMQRSQRQNSVMKEMQCVIHKQRLSIEVWIHF